MSTETPLLLTLPILERMRSIEGWLWDEEADLLIAATVRALDELPAPHAIVEIGSYCGRSTVVLGSVVRALEPEARVYAIDPHDGQVGAVDRRLSATPPTLARFEANVAAAGVRDVVVTVQRRSYETEWDKPIAFLFIDGLHDYSNVSRDFHHFEPWLVPGGFVAFHDYAPYYPGVQAFVNDVLAGAPYQRIHCAGSMMLLRRHADGAAL